ncbi:MAG: hypothetical protein LBV69_05610 [Bacteroidales bacterium]|jgi:hypothetical protein|nr:hypothetical protein [Bacteroidales bacterium]
MRKKIVIFLLLIVYVFEIHAQEITLTKKQMYQDFDELIEILQDCNAQLPIRKAVTGIDLLSRVKVLRANIDTITSTNIFLKHLDNVLDLMLDIHARQFNNFDIKYDNLSGIDTIIINYRKNLPPEPRKLTSFGGATTNINGEYYFIQTLKIMSKDEGTISLFFPKIILYKRQLYSEFVKKEINRDLSERFNYDKKEFYVTHYHVPYSGMLTLQDKYQTVNLNLDKGYGVMYNSILDSSFIKSNVPLVNYESEKVVLYFERGKILYICLDKMNDEEGKIVEKIKDAGNNKIIKKVIIDVRNNTGGGDRTWHNVLKAIVADSLLYNPTLAFKNTKLLKTLYDYPNAFYDIKKFDVKEFNWLPGERFLVSTIEPEYMIPDSNSLNYKGKIYILQNENVFSAAHSFSSYAKHLEQLVSVGEPTGMLSGFGIMPALFQLKNSKFTFRLETAIDVSFAENPVDVYQDFPEVEIFIPSEKKLEWMIDRNYVDVHSEEYLYKYDYLFQKVLELE